MSFILRRNNRLVWTACTTQHTVFVHKRSFQIQSVMHNQATSPKCTFSGIQPTGVPHLGNYLGAIRPWVEQQKHGDTVILSIVDLHSVTLPKKPSVLRSNIRSMAASLLACGIDPEKTILFQQSQVSAHAELGWLLGCLTTLPRLQHLPQWKEKSESLKETPLGVFTYPVLQAADILLYKASHVPVGDDQVKHIELARHLAKSFNKKFGHLFPMPNPVTGDHNRIKSLRNPASKMSKSDPDDKSRIELTDDRDAVNKKLRKAITDCTSTITYEPEQRPGITNLVDMHCALTDLFPEDIVEDPKMMLMDTLQYKEHVAGIVSDYLAPIQAEMARIEQDPGYVVQVLEQGNKKAEAIARETLDKAKDLMGMTL